MVEPRESQDRRSTCFIILGKIVLFDEEDLPLLSLYDWTISAGYAVTSTHPKEYMHHILMGVHTPRVVDHENRDCLDNRKSNLRVLSHGANLLNQNAENVFIRMLVSGELRYDASIQYNKRRINLGTFRTHKRAKIVAERAKRDIYAGAVSVVGFRTLYGVRRVIQEL